MNKNQSTYNQIYKRKQDIRRINQSVNIFVKVIIFLIYPFGGFLYALTDFKSKSSIIVFYLYFLLFGFAFTPEKDGLDSYRYVERFNYTTFETSDDFVDFTTDFFSFESERTKDIYLFLSYYIVGLFTNNYHFLFLLFAMIFGFFYLKTFSILVSNRNMQYSLVMIVLMLWFGLSNPIFNINGVRFWTASWIAVFVMYQVFIRNRKTFLILALITPLIHASFYLFLFLLVLMLFTRKFEKFWIPVFYFSLLGLGTSFLSFTENFVELLPPFLQRMVYLYTESDDALSKIAGIEKHFIIQIVEKLPQLFMMIMLFLVIKHREILKKNTVSRNLYQILLVWYSFVFFTINISSVGVRFFALGIPLIVYLWVNSYSVFRQYNQIIIIGLPIAYSYVVWGWFVKMSMVTEPSFYFSPLYNIIANTLTR
jgi:hypothetical protein